MITVYTVSYNEEILIKFMIDHYRERFSNCRIVVYDNMSTDKTVEIAQNNGCEVRINDTGGKIIDRRYLEIKNNCWKNNDAKTDWVLVCDVDELLDINESQLKEEESKGFTIIKGVGYNMVNMEDNYDLDNIKYGSPCDPYDKMYLFNKKFINEIGYLSGCHKANPRGQIKINEGNYKAYHYICIHPDLQVAKYKLYSSRLSDENKKNKEAFHYNQSEEHIRQTFALARTYVTKIRD